MSDSEAVSAHYGRAGLLDEVLEHLRAAGVDAEHLDLDVLAGFDEFHLGGRPATLAVVEAVGIDAGSRVLDVGCGIGGPARTIAATSGAQVAGVDLTPEFVEAARELSRRAGLDGQTSFEVGDGLALPAEDGTVDVVTVLHVGMNVADKPGLFAEAARVLRPGGALAVYDLMRTGPGELTFPVPWSVGPEGSFVETPEHYRQAMTAAELIPSAPTDRTDAAMAWAAAMLESPPAVGLGEVVGADWPTMIGNLVPLVGAGVLAPVLIVARAAG